MKKIISIFIIMFVLASCAFATSEDSLKSFHEYSNIMPFMFENRSATDGIMILYYYNVPFETVESYISQFNNCGWETYAMGEDGDWDNSYYIMDANSEQEFLILYSNVDMCLCICYNNGAITAFDPAESL